MKQDISGPKAGKFRRKDDETIVRAAQLTWQTWSEVCDVLGEGGGTRWYGVYVNPATGSYAREDGMGPTFTDIGVVFPSEIGSQLVRQDIWIVVNDTPPEEVGRMWFISPSEFDAHYEKIDG